MYYLHNIAPIVQRHTLKQGHSREVQITEMSRVVITEERESHNRVYIEEN